MMTQLAERRYHERFDIEAPILYSLFTSQPSGDFNATAKNCSEGGLYFEAGDKLLPGQYIRVRLNQPALADIPRPAREGIKTNAIARVRWCVKNDDIYKTPYGVGVSYC
jgi:hypothetical protein